MYALTVYSPAACSFSISFWFAPWLYKGLFAHTRTRHLVGDLVTVVLIGVAVVLEVCREKKAFV
jgi:hypothetical protein